MKEGTRSKSRVKGNPEPEARKYIYPTGCCQGMKELTGNMDTAMLLGVLGVL